MSGSIRANKFCANFLFMTRLPKKRGITQVEEDKSLILRRLNLNPDVLGLQELVNSSETTFAS